MIFEHSNYRAYLKAALAQRTGSNPSYSMSAWARKLGIAPGFFSEVLNGKKNLSQEAVLKISHTLNLGSRETEYFSLLLQQETTKNPEVKERVVKRLNDMRPKVKIHNLQVDLFRAISDWYCFAIMELTYVDGFEFTPKNIAKRLGITQLEAEAAVERLLRLELLSKDEQTGRHTKTQSYVFVESAIPNEAVRKFHDQIMENASRGLKLPRSQRKSRSEVLPIPLDILPEVEKILDEAAEKITALARESSSKKEEIYGLSLQFAPLSRERKQS